MLYESLFSENCSIIQKWKISDNCKPNSVISRVYGINSQVIFHPFPLFISFPATYNMGIWIAVSSPSVVWAEPSRGNCGAFLTIEAFGAIYNLAFSGKLFD